MVVKNNLPTNKTFINEYEMCYTSKKFYASFILSFLLFVLHLLARITLDQTEKDHNRQRAINGIQ